MKRVLVLMSLILSVVSIVSPSIPETFAANSRVQVWTCTAPCAPTNNLVVGNKVVVNALVDACDANPAQPSLSSPGIGSFVQTAQTAVQSNTNTLECVSTYRGQITQFIGVVTSATKPQVTCTGCIKWSMQEVSGISSIVCTSGTVTQSTAGTNLTLGSNIAPCQGSYVAAAYGICRTGTYSSPAGWTIASSVQGAGTSGTCSAAASVYGLGDQSYTTAGASMTTKCPMTASQSGRFLGLCVSYYTRVTDTVTITVDNGGTQGSALTVSNCNPDVTTIAMDGAAHSIVFDGHCSSATFTVPTDGATSRYRFSGPSTTWAYTTEDTTGGSHSNTLYLELKNTFDCIPASPATWDAVLKINITGTAAGASSTVIATCTTANGGGGVIAAGGTGGWSDYGRTDTFQTPVSGWQTASSNPAPTTGGNEYWGVYCENAACAAGGATTTTTTTTSTSIVADPPNYLWLVLIPIFMLLFIGWGVKRRL